MGFVDFLLAGPRIEDIKMAYVGRYVFNKINDSKQKENIYWHANEKFNYAYNSGNKFENDYLEKTEMRLQFIAIAMAMMEIGIDHGLKNYQWRWIKKPALVVIYGNELWEVAVVSLKQRSGISVEYIPPDIIGNEVVMPKH